MRYVFDSVNEYQVEIEKFKKMYRNQMLRRLLLNNEDTK